MARARKVCCLRRVSGEEKVTKKVTKKKYGRFEITQLLPARPQRCCAELTGGRAEPHAAARAAAMMEHTLIPTRFLTMLGHVVVPPHPRPPSLAQGLTPATI